MTEFESSHLDTNNMLEEEPVLKLFHPTTGEELYPDSIQYQAMSRFLCSYINQPGPLGMSNQQDNDFHQCQDLPGEGL